MNIETEKMHFPYNLSTSQDNRLPQRYAGMLYGNINADVCANTGIFSGEDDSVAPAMTIAQLKASIATRATQLAQLAATSSPADQAIASSTNPVRLAVHSLLASKDLLGGIGQQVSTIAKQMN